MMKNKVYVVLEEQTSYFGDEYHNTWVFDSEEKAKVKLQEQVELYKKENTSWEDLIVDESPTKFECCEEGYYPQEHYWITINEQKVL